MYCILLMLLIINKGCRVSQTMPCSLGSEPSKITIRHCLISVAIIMLADHHMLVLFLKEGFCYAIVLF